MYIFFYQNKIKVKNFKINKQNLGLLLHAQSKKNKQTITNN